MKDNEMQDLIGVGESDPEQQSIEIVCVLDRSGSMSSVTNDTIEGFNAFLDEQKKEPGTAKLTLVLFDHEYTVIHDGVDIQDVPYLDSNLYVARGWTALYDAIGQAVNTVQERMNSMSEADKPDKILVAILTDGHENRSEEYTSESVGKIISEKEADGWEFAFLGANQDACLTASELSFGNVAAAAANYDASGIGTRSAFGAISKKGLSMRGVAPQHFNRPMEELYAETMTENQEAEANQEDDQDNQED